MKLLHLEVNEIVVGAAAYNAIQRIRLYYNRFPETTYVTTRRSISFYIDVLYTEKLQDHIDIIVNALTERLPTKDCLLRNILSQIAVKTQQSHAISESEDKKHLFDGYQFYEEYVTAILVDLPQGKYAC